MYSRKLSIRVSSLSEKSGISGDLYHKDHRLFPPAGLHSLGRPEPGPDLRGPRAHSANDLAEKFVVERHRGHLRSALLRRSPAAAGGPAQHQYEIQSGNAQREQRLAAVGELLRHAGFDGCFLSQLISLLP